MAELTSWLIFMGPRPSLLTSSGGHVILQGIAAASRTTPPASPTENYRWNILSTGRVGRSANEKELCTFPKKAAELTLHFSDFFVLVDRCVSANLPNLWSQWVSSSFWGIHLFHLWVIIWIFTTWSLQPHNFLESSEARCSSVACQKPTQLRGLVDTATGAAQTNV